MARTSGNHSRDLGFKNEVILGRPENYVSKFYGKKTIVTWKMNDTDISIHRQYIRGFPDIADKLNSDREILQYLHYPHMEEISLCRVLLKYLALSASRSYTVFTTQCQYAI